MNKPNCHKPSFEAGVDHAGASGRASSWRWPRMFQLRNNDRYSERKEHDVNGKKDTKKKGTLRPWLVDVSLDHLR